MARHLVFVVLALSLAACGGGDGRGRIVFRLSTERLSDLGRGLGHYEGFAIVNGIPVSTGKFVVNAATTPAAITSPDGERVYGTTLQATFGPSATGLGENFPFIEDASGFFVTIEPEGDRDGVPSGNVVMAGMVQGRAADLDSVGLQPLGGPGLGDLSTASGLATLVTPTGGGANPESGLWFVADAAGTMPGLTLPPAEGAWTYEGFVRVGTTYWSTGKFRSSSTFDFDAQTNPAKGPTGVGFRAPGQDFLGATTVGASEMLDLAEGGWRVEVTLEPRIDNAMRPFPLRVFEAVIPTAAVNMAGQGVAEIELTNVAASLASLDVTLSPGLITCNGSAPQTLGSAAAGFYTLWVEVSGGMPERIADFIGPDGPGVVTSPDGSVVYGGSASFGFDPVNTGLLAAFPDVAAATRVFITQEPVGLVPTVPSEAIVLDGVPTSGVAPLRYLGALGNLTAASGTVVCLSPTDDLVSLTPNDERGLWFRFLGDDFPSLIIPDLDSAWTYEGWVVHPPTARRFSTGKFRSGINPDEDAATFPGKGPNGIGFSDPGQDFVTMTAGTMQPALPDLRGATVIVTLEPLPDTGLAPSPYILLEGTMPAAALIPSAPFVNRTSELPEGRLEF